MSFLIRSDRLESTSCGEFAAHASPLAAAGSYWQRLVERWQNQRRDREAIAALRRLDDRELRDIGLGRSDIEGAVRGTLDLRRR